jgi:Na+/melibiose symporter-like transporter
VPFIASALLVVVGLYVRFTLAETPAFAAVLAHKATHALPLRALLKTHARAVLLGALAMGVCYNLFYTATVFCLSYGTGTLGISRPNFLGMLCVAILAMTLATPMAAAWSDRIGRRPVLLRGALAAMLAGFLLAPALQSGSLLLVTAYLALLLFLMGVTFAPMGAFLPEQFPAAVRYSGAGLAYSLGGILGASLAPAISQALVQQGGLALVGGYVSVMAGLSALAVLGLRTRVG